MRREFRPPNYGDIKKVKSIWLCFDPPDYAKGTITSFRTTQKNIYGNMPENNTVKSFLSVQEGDYGVERGAQKLHLSVTEFEKKMQEAGYKIPETAE